MSVNTLNFEQVSTVLTSIVKQATGQTVLTPTDTGSFVSVAQIALRADRDAVMNAISNLVGRTLFAIRPLDDVMPGLEMDSFRWGNVMRKLSIADSDWSDDPAYAWPATYDSTKTVPNGDGGNIDPWTIKKPDILQTNFYGASVYFDEMSIFEDQIETAFSGPEQLGSFLSLIMTNLKNRLTFSNESIKRGLVCNAIGSLYHENDSNRVIHLLTEYNTVCGFATPLTVADIYQPDNFPAFMKWMYARIANISDLFKANSEMFQTVVSGKHILRHTPLEMQRVYLYSPLLQQMSARVLADAYHENFLRYSDVESLTFWQSIGTPDTVKVTPMYTNTSGALATTTAQTVENVVGLIFDRDAMGMTVLDRRVLSTPLNTKGLYRNLHVHAKQRVFMDNTEKMALLLLD